MQPRTHGLPIWLVLTLIGGLVAACVAGLWFAPSGFFARLQLARSTWEAQQPQHYRMTARWTYGTIVNGPWSIEVRDGLVLSGIDVRSQRALTRAEILLAQENIEIGVLFDAIYGEVKPSRANTTRNMIARTLAEVSPELRDLIARCAARIPSVEYHPALGYPVGVTAHGSPCYRASEWTVRVTELSILP
jgi:hypothetical protein